MKLLSKPPTGCLYCILYCKVATQNTEKPGETGPSLYKKPTRALSGDQACVTMVYNREEYRLEKAKHRHALRVAFKYALFQIPELLLFAVALTIAGRWINIPDWFFWSVMVLLMVKNGMLFPLVRRAYDNRDVSSAESLIGTKGTVIEFLNPTGYVRVSGELWKAKVSGQGQTIAKGEWIRVEGVKGFCLIVGRIDSPGSNSGES